MVVEFYLAIYSLIYVFLSIYVIKNRRSYHISIGYDENINMLRAMRAHANFSEYTPIFLLLMLVSEMRGMSFFLLHTLGILFLAGRITHAYGLLKQEKVVAGKTFRTQFRVLGMSLTFISILFFSGFLILNYVVK